MKAKLIGYLAFLLFTFTVVSCGDDETKPQAASTFTVSTTTAKLGEEILFMNASTNATAFKWSFGDGTTSKEISPKKTYTSSGTFVVSLLSTGAGGSMISSTEITILPDPEVYFTEYGASIIRKFGISTPAKVSDFLDVTGKAGVGLAYDATNEKIYFSDFEVTGEGKIWSINLDGTDLKMLVEDLYDPYQIALDIPGGKMYWAEDADDDGFAHVRRADLDGTDMENLATIDGGWCTGVALDLKNDKLYYYDINGEDLYRANLDGSDAMPILSDVYGYAIAVDAENDKIYFDEQYTPGLLMADLDGSNVKTVDDTDTRIYGISIDNENDKLYWTGRDSEEIYQSNLDGSHKEILKTGVSSPRGIFFKK